MNILLLLIALLACTNAHALDYDFNRRFGPDSHIYNIPLYFAQTNKTCKKTTKKCNKKEKNLTRTIPSCSQK